MHHNPLLSFPFKTIKWANPTASTSIAHPHLPHHRRYKCYSVLRRFHARSYSTPCFSTALLRPYKKHTSGQTSILEVPRQTISTATEGTNNLPIVLAPRYALLVHGAFLRMGDKLLLCKTLFPHRLRFARLSLVISCKQLVIIFCFT